MSTLSVPLPPNLEHIVNRFVKSGYASTKAEVVRKALRNLAEERAIADVLAARREVREGKILRNHSRFTSSTESFRGPTVSR